MKYAPGTMVRLSHRIVIQSQNSELDLEAGDTAIIMSEETVVFDPDCPDNSTETLYNCLVRGRMEQLFEIDFEVMTR